MCTIFSNCVCLHWLLPGVSVLQLGSRSLVTERGLLFPTPLRLLIAVASLVAERGLSVQGLHGLLHVTQ